MSRAFLVVAIILACTTANAIVNRAPKAHQLTAQYSFEQYMKDFDKHYRPIEKEERAKIFAKNLKEILRHNAAGTSSYKKGINQFTDATERELKNLRGSRYEPTYKSKFATDYLPKGNVAAGRTVDWREHRPAVLTAIKDQGQCGDCWAHSVTEEIETSYAITNGDLFVLSQQQVTACSPQVGQCYSCGGSFPSIGYDYVAQTGITEEWIYPFASYNGSNVACVADPFLPTPIRTTVNITGHTNVAPNSQHDFIDALNNLGPLGILVDASGWSSYESGIFDGCDYANNITLDHAVQAVGYGVDENANEYWIVRNSWAPSWGEHGYIRLHKAATPSCGWNTGAQSPMGCYGSGPTASWSCGQCGILFAGQFPTVAKV